MPPPIAQSVVRSTALEVWNADWSALVKPTERALQAVQAVWILETGNARAWKGAMTDSFNYGSIHCSRPVDGACPPGSAPGGDTLEGKKIKVCFCTYADDREGIRAALRELLRRGAVRQVIGSGDAGAIATAMLDTNYYGGIPGTREEKIADYAGRIEAGARHVAGKLGQPLLVRAGFLPGGLSVGAWVGIGVLAAAGAGAGYWFWSSRR